MDMLFTFPPGVQVLGPMTSGQWVLKRNYPTLLQGGCAITFPPVAPRRSSFSACLPAFGVDAIYFSLFYRHVACLTVILNSYFLVDSDIEFFTCSFVSHIIFFGKMSLRVFLSILDWIVFVPSNFEGSLYILDSWFANLLPAAFHLCKGLLQSAKF